MLGEILDKVTELDNGKTVASPTVIRWPSPVVTSKAAGGGKKASLPLSSISSKTTVMAPSGKSVDADCGTGPKMSGVVALSTFEARLVPSSLIAKTR